MKLIDQSKNRKEFANKVFLKLASLVGGWEKLSAIKTKGKNETLWSIPKYKLANIFFESKAKASLEDLMSGGDIRYQTVPFYQNQQGTLYAYLSTEWRYNSEFGLEIGKLQKMVNTEFAYFFRIDIIENTFQLFESDNVEYIMINPLPINAPSQKIYFGSPGTGKSRAMDEFANKHSLVKFRYTFHPDTDYSSFVGAYKPSMQGDKITYSFVPQAFTKAYVAAKKNPEQGYLLAIEEINRGNCSQIFGDIFQCLDRKAGVSEYPIEPDTALAQYLESEGLEPKICLPANLFIYATMNTSDQSLFPMDAAFKRRWEWQYVPIDMADAESIEVEVGDVLFRWSSFIEKINACIYAISKSEDKKLGNRFVNPANGNRISTEQFVNKVLFYLWAEIYKDEHETGDTIFQYTDAEGQAHRFSYTDLFLPSGYDLPKIKGFLTFNQVV